MADRALSTAYKKIPIDFNEAFIGADLGFNLEKYFSRWINKFSYQQNLIHVQKKKHWSMNQDLKG